MEIRALGSQGLKASQMGLGCMGMSEFYGPGDEKESIRTIHRALELGVNFLDTSDAYGPFKNEELVGKAIQGKRDQFVVATKFGIVRDLSDPQKRSINGKPEYVKKSCEASLRRLGIETIDLYYLHRVDPDTPVEETVGAMGELVTAGKVRGIGLSEVTVPTLRRAHQVFPLSALQTEYSLWYRQPEDDILQACRELGIAFVAYSPLGRGFLTGRIRKMEDLVEDDWRRGSSRFHQEFLDKNLTLVDKLNIMASRKGCTASQLALAWVMAQGDSIFPIPGTKRVKYLEENAAAASIDLSDSELKELDEHAPKGFGFGDRYPESAMKFVNQ